MKIYLILFLIIAISCDNKGKNQMIENVIALDINIEDFPSFDESNYDLSFEIVPLELTKNSMIGDIFLVEKTDKYIYTYNRQGVPQILIFKSNGEFVKEIEQGKANNEIINPTFFSIDRNSNNIEVLDRQSIIKRYTESGEYIDMIDTELYHLEFSRIGNKYLLYNANNSKKNGEYYYTLLDVDNDNKTYHIKHCQGKGLMHFYPNHIHYNNDNLYFSANNDDKIYKLSKTESSPTVFAQVNNIFNGVGMTDMSNEQIQTICGNSKFSFFTSFGLLCDSKLIHLSVNKTDRLFSIFYDIESKKSYKSIFHGIPYLSMVKSTYNDMTIHVFNPIAFDKIDKTKLSDKLISLYDMMKQRYDKFGIDENPYLVIVKYAKNK